MKHDVISVSKNIPETGSNSSPAQKHNVCLRKQGTGWMRSTAVGSTVTECPAEPCKGFLFYPKCRGKLSQGFEQKSDRQNTHFKKVALAIVRINCRTSRVSIGMVRSLSPSSGGGSSVAMMLEVPEC